MKCKMKVGELREALATASITMDRRAGSEYGFVYLGAKRMKSGANQRLILNSTDGIRRFLLKVVCEVEEIGDLVIDPIRLSTILDKRGDDEAVTFTQDVATKRTIVRCGGSRIALMSSGKPLAFDMNMKAFPAPDTKPTFLIESANLKSMLDQTQSFIYRKDDKASFKTLMIRTTGTGYEAFTTNSECIANGRVEDTNSPGLTDGKPVRMLEIPQGALSSLSKLLNRNKKETIQVIVVKSPDGRDQAAYFRTELAFFGTNLMASTQPPMDAVFKAQVMTMEVQVPRDGLLTSISRSSPFCSETVAGRLVCLDVKNSIVRLSAQDQFGEFEEELATATPATGVGRATFRSDFLSDALRSSSADLVVLKMGLNSGNIGRPSAVLSSGAGGAGATYVIAGICDKEVLRQLSNGSISDQDTAAKMASMPKAAA